MLMAPETVFLPNSVPWGPRRTSIDWMSSTDWFEAAERPTQIPSTYTPTRCS